MNDYAIYTNTAEEFVAHYSDVDLKVLLHCEAFDLELCFLLANLMKGFLEMEEYRYCVHVRDYFRLHREILNGLLP